MKKYIILSFIIGLLSTNRIFSQNEIRYGINGGLTFSKLWGNEATDKLDIGVDVLTGISFELKVNEDIFLKTNLNYERKSMNKTNTLEVPDNLGSTSRHKIKSIFTYEYATLPIMIKYKIDRSSNFFINGGPFIGYLIQRKTKSTSANKLTSDSDYKKFDIGLSVGIGTKIHLDKVNDLGIELRENLGLMNINNVDVDQNAAIRTQAFNLILTMDFE